MLLVPPPPRVAMKALSRATDCLVKVLDGHRSGLRQVERMMKFVVHRGETLQCERLLRPELLLKRYQRRVKKPLLLQARANTAQWRCLEGVEPSPLLNQEQRDVARLVARRVCTPAEQGEPSLLWLLGYVHAFIPSRRHPRRYASHLAICSRRDRSERQFSPSGTLATARSSTSSSMDSTRSTASSMKSALQPWRWSMPGIPVTTGVGVTSPPVLANTSPWSTLRIRPTSCRA